MPITVDTTTTTPRHRTRSEADDRRRRFGEAADVWSGIATGWATALDDVIESMGRGLDLGSERGRRRGACGCERDECSCDRGCDRDSCHCQCCIGDADLVVYARLGEVRLLPVRIENHRRRARDITLELGEFRTSGGRTAPLQATIVGERSFELEPCEERVVTLAVRSQPLDDDDDDRTNDGRRDLPDVDDCLVAYTELRVAGCDIRSIRIAVALLPRDCDAYVAECGCGCC